MYKNHAEKVSKAKLMFDGLTKNNSNLPAGITEERMNELTTHRTKVENLNSEQEQLKAQLSNKTQELQVEMKKMDKLMAEFKKRIKLDYPQSLWREFGIDDKK